MVLCSDVQGTQWNRGLPKAVGNVERGVGERGGEVWRGGGKGVDGGGWVGC